MDLQLAGKTVLITGGSKGIGKASAEVLAEEGCNLILVARDAAVLNETAAEIRAKRQVNVRTIAADLSSDAAAAHGGPGGGRARYPGQQHLLSIDDTRWRQAWDLKVFGYISFCRVVYAQMKARRAGVIINVIGAAGEQFPTGYIAGAAGNASLMAFTRALGKGAPADGLRVVGINPGPVETDRLVMLRKAEAKAKWGDEGRWRELSAGMAFGRPASPREIGNAVAFLASPASGYTTGTILTINGGG